MGDPAPRLSSPVGREHLLQLCTSHQGPCRGQGLTAAQTGGPPAELKPRAAPLCVAALAGPGCRGSDPPPARMKAVLTGHPSSVVALRTPAEPEPKPEPAADTASWAILKSAQRTALKSRPASTYEQWLHFPIARVALQFRTYPQRHSAAGTLLLSIITTLCSTAPLPASDAGEAPADAARQAVVAAVLLPMSDPSPLLRGWPRSCSVLFNPRVLLEAPWCPGMQAASV